MERSPDQILRDAGDALELAKRGLREFSECQGRQRASGIRNIAVWGRVTTASLQKLKRVHPDSFPTWWSTHAQALSQDPEFKYLYDLRNDIEKEGTVGGVSSSLYIDRLDSSDLASLRASPPAHTKGFFIGDKWGGSGWDIEMPDGTRDKFYVKLPHDIAVSTTLHFSDATSSLGIPPPKSSMETLLARYVRFLEDLMGSARKEFGSPSI